MELGFPGAAWRPWGSPNSFSSLVRSLASRSSGFLEAWALHHAAFLKPDGCCYRKSHGDSRLWSAGAVAASRNSILQLCSRVGTLNAGCSPGADILSLLSAAVMVPGLSEKLLGEVARIEGDAGLDQMLDADDENGEGQGAIEDLSLACIVVTKALKDGFVKEPTTGVAFPATLCKDADGSCNLLAGVGVRSKNLIKIKSIHVYAFGLYVKPKNLQKVLGPKYAGINPEVLKFQPEFYNDLLTNELDMTVRLVVHYRGLNMDMVRTAFQTSLTNRLAKIGGSDEDGLRDFTGYFTNDKKLRRGTTIDFRWQPGGKFHTEIDGKRVGTLVSPRLCQAFFDLYIGEPPVSQRAKEEIGESFARMLTGC